MTNSADTVAVLHISPQPANRTAAVKIATDKLQHEFSLACNRIVLDTVVAAKGLPQPKDLEHFAGMVISGSVHSVYENLDWIQNVEELVRSAVDRRLAMLGICWGHQVAVQALGGTVEKGEHGLKIGTYGVELSDLGERDALYDGTPKHFTATSWHGDVAKKLPEGAQQLASGEVYPIQSLAVGDTLRTVQFHPEFDQETLEAMVAATQPDQPVEYKDRLDFAELGRIGAAILRNFAKRFVLMRR